MAATLTYAVDPVTQGAAEIQATTFALKQTDFSLSDWQKCSSALRQNGLRAKTFPNSDQSGWMYYRRNDLAVVQIIGIQVVATTERQNVLLITAGKQVEMFLQYVEVTVNNWFPVKQTLTDGSIIQSMMVNRATVQLMKNAESGVYFIDDVTYKQFVETSGFLFTQGAAAYPASTLLGKIAVFTQPI